MSILEAPDAPFRLTAPIEHLTKLDDGTVLAHVTVTSESPDSQGEIVDYDAFKAAAPDLMKWAVLNEMHDPDRMDAGTILRLHFDDARRTVEADVHVVDPVAVKKVLSRTYKMVSIGGTVLESRRESVGGRVVKRLTKLIADHLALVPRGANPDAMIAKQFVLAKMETAVTDTLDAGMASPLETAVPPTLSETRTPEQIAIDATREALAKDIDGPPEGGKDRTEIPPEDFAGKDSSYPIVTPDSVDRAARAIGRAGDDNYSADELRANIIRIATRKGPAFVAALPKAWRKEARKMAKAAEAAQAAATEEVITKADDGDADDAEATEKADAPADEGDAKPAFPGAKPPFKGKKAAAKAAKIAKAKERKAADAALVKAVTATPDDPTATAVKRLAKQARRAAKLAKANTKLRKARAALRKERKELKKASVLTEVLTKSGARNSKADIAKIDAIHEATVDLGTTSHAQPVASSDDMSNATAATEHDQMAKSATPVDAGATMRQALQDVGLAPGAVAQIEARLAALDEKSTAQGESLAKIGKYPTGGGPASSYVMALRGEQDATPMDKGNLLAAAASVIDEPRLKTDVSNAATLELISKARSTS